jgi:hypothetical protein
VVLQLTVFWYIGAVLGHVCLGLGVLALGTMLLSWVFFFPQWGLGVCVVLWSVGCKSIQFLVHSFIMAHRWDVVRLLVCLCWWAGCPLVERGRGLYGPQAIIIIIIIIIKYLKKKGDCIAVQPLDHKTTQHEYEQNGRKNKTPL